MASRGPFAFNRRELLAYVLCMAVALVPASLAMLLLKRGWQGAPADMALAFAALLAMALVPLPLLLCRGGVKNEGSGNACVSPFLGKSAQLIHAGRLAAMGEMVPGVAHELNQPLCVLRGYLELLKMSLADVPAMKERNLDEIFDICIKSVDKASKIVGQMRSFVRQKPADPKPVDLRKPIDEGMAFFNEQIKQHNIELVMDFEKGLPEVLIDQQKFEQIAVNLLANARSSVDAKGETLGREYKKRIELKLRQDRANNKIVFEVIDNGFGMNLETIDRCKEPFFTTKSAGEGTGLGVSIVKEILREAGGELQIESDPGEGCVFRTIFPAYREDLKPPVA